MKEIQLTQGKVALVDDEDFESVNQFKWYAQNKRGSFYAARKSSETAEIMHRFLLKPPSGMVIDHIDGNSLNNQRKNLRIVTPRQNSLNRRKGKGATTSKFKGVNWDKFRKRWVAQIRVFKKHPKRIGVFLSEIEAALAYNEAAIKYHGEFARLNIIPPNSPP